MAQTRSHLARDENFQMKEERDVFVTMRDGVKIAVDLFRPDAPRGRKFPALVAMSPYGKGMQSLQIKPQATWSPASSPSIEAGDPAYFVSQGYVHIIADVRGTGHSKGEYNGWMSKKEAEDGYDLIEWAAAQEWCDGNVGMVGISYFGTIQLIVAKEQPPHLRAIMPWNAVGDFYREATHHGGILQMFFFHLYTRSIGAEKSVSSTMKNLTDKEVKDLVEEIKSDPDVRAYPDIYRYVDCPRKHPCWFDVIVNAFDGEFYWERSPYKHYEKIRIPFYTSSGWWAYRHMHLIGCFNHYLEIQAPKKLMINPPVEEERPLPLEYSAEAVRWYDHWLKGKDNGVMTEPPIKLFVRGINEWRFEKEWPLARTDWTKYYFRVRRSLQESERASDSQFDEFVQQPLRETTKIESVVYETRALSQDLEVTGPAAVYLHASIDQPDTTWLISLRDASNGGDEVELSMGFLRASHREVDGQKSKPWYPFHPHLHKDPVVPGREYEYAIGLAPISNVFKKGHKIKLVVSSMDYPESSVHHPWHMCNSITTQHRVFHGSYALLPIIRQ